MFFISESETKYNIEMYFHFFCHMTLEIGIQEILKLWRYLSAEDEQVSPLSFSSNQRNIHS